MPVRCCFNEIVNIWRSERERHRDGQKERTVTISSFLDVPLAAGVHKYQTGGNGIIQWWISLRLLGAGSPVCRRGSAHGPRIRRNAQTGNFRRGHGDKRIRMATRIPARRKDWAAQVNNGYFHFLNLRRISPFATDNGGQVCLVAVVRSVIGKGYSSASQQSVIGLCNTGGA